MMTIKSPKVAKSFVCETCGYICSKQSDYNKHCSTRKHKMMTNDDHKIADIEPTHICSRCDKSYKTKQSLWVHKQKCKAPEKENISIVILDDDAVNTPIPKYIMKLVEHNQELKNMFIQQQNDIQRLMTNPPIQNTTINNNKTIHNTQFNLNVFLQETCKDAINMSDFIETLKIDVASLHHTGTHGYVNGISKIFTDGLRKLKVHERPIHCSDLKREVFYIKDNDKWEKDTEDNKQFKKALDKVVYRNMGQLEKWVSKRSLQPGTAYGGSEEEENPRCRIQETDDYEFYFEVIRQSLGGGNHEVTARNNEKILKAIAKEVHIDKKVKELL